MFYIYSCTLMVLQCRQTMSYLNSLISLFHCIKNKTVILNEIFLRDQFAISQLTQKYLI